MSEKKNRLPCFTERFRELRDRYGDNTSCANALGLTRQTVGSYSNGDRVPDAGILRQISERSGISTDWLLGLTDVDTPDKSIRAACESTGLSEGAVSVIKTASDMADHQQAEIPPVLDMFLSECQDLVWTLVELTNVGSLIATRDAETPDGRSWKDIFPEDYADTMKAQTEAVHVLWNRYNPMIAATPEEQLDTLRAKATRQFESIVDKISDTAITSEKERVSEKLSDWEEIKKRPRSGYSGDEK